MIGYTVEAHVEVPDVKELVFKSERVPVDHETYYELSMLVWNDHHFVAQTRAREIIFDLFGKDNVPYHSSIFHPFFSRHRLFTCVVCKATCVGEGFSCGIEIVKKVERLARVGRPPPNKIYASVKRCGYFFTHLERTGDHFRPA